jgi:hypothetical protein
VALKILAGRQARIEIPDALVIGHKIDPLANPQWNGDIAGERDQTPPLAAAVRVDPHIAGAPATIPLPARRVALIAPDDHAAVWSIRHVNRWTGREKTRLAAIGSDSVQQGRSRKRRMRRTGKQNIASIAAPTAYTHCFAEKGHAARFTARSRHHKDFPRSLVASDKRQQGTIG